MSTLSELREALNALGVATDTGSLRGEQRRVELFRRLQAVRGGCNPPTDKSKPAADSRGGDGEPRSLAELRQALEARGLPTHTPGLKGDARRHALAQRLLNAQRGGGGDSSQTSRSRLEAVPTEEDDTASEAGSSSSSTAYSTAREFLFFDLPTDRKTQAKPNVPVLRLPGSTYPPVELEAVQDALFERRQQLHDLRQEQQRQVNAALDRAGIPERLEALSARLEALTTEKQRLESSFTGSQLVTSLVLGSLSARHGSADDLESRELELVQQDAILLLQRHEKSTRQLIERTKQAVAIAKTARRGEDDAGDAASSSGRSSVSSSYREGELEREVRELEARIQTHSSRSIVSLQPASSIAKDSGLVLLRCRSVPHNMFLHEWKQLSPEQRAQLHSELRQTASSRIQHGRVCLRPATARLANESGDSRRPPSLADRLGVKARFLEASGRPALEVHRAFQAALQADADHASSLLHYARFLAFRLGGRANSSQADRLLRRALEIDPNDPQALATYAALLCREGEVDKAASLQDRAVKLLKRGDPARPGVLGDYADALLLSAASSSREETTQRLRMARQLLAEALDAAPGHEQNRHRLLRVLAALASQQRR